MQQCTKIKIFLSYSCLKEEECTEDFKELTVNSPKKEKYMGNSGYLAVKEPKNSLVNVYKYSRFHGIEGKFHSEPDLMDLLSTVELKNKIIYISSYYCTCLSCLNKLVSFVRKNRSLKIHFYCWEDMKFNNYDSFEKFIDQNDGNLFEKCDPKDKNQILEVYKNVYSGVKKINRLELHHFEKEEIKLIKAKHESRQFQKIVRKTLN